MAEIEIFNPDTLNTPRGTYSHVAEVKAGAKLVVIAGQVSLDKDGNIVGDGFFEKQCAQVYENIGNALKAAGGDWKNVIQFMSFLTRKEDLPRFVAFRKQEFPKFYPDGVYPPNTLLVVSALASDEILLEVQAIAAI